MYQHFVRNFNELKVAKHGEENHFILATNTGHKMKLLEIESEIMRDKLSILLNALDSLGDIKIL